jgi:hypothetical protein
MPTDSQRAEEILKSRILSLGANQQLELLAQVARTVIRDKLVFPKAMVFSADDSTQGPGICITYLPEHGTPEQAMVHPHALGQLTDKSRPSKDAPGLNRKYVWELCSGEFWHRELLADTLNRFYHMGSFVDRKKNPAKFLHRLVDNQLCGFLSRSFNRNLNTMASLKAFIEACAACGAGPFSSGTTLVRTYLKCVLPTIFEPVPGEFVAFGVNYANSDFGDGTLNISNVIYRVNSTDLLRQKYGSTMVLDSAFSRTHLGSIIQESDIELSDVTANKEVAAVNSAIKDVVAHQLNQETIDKILDAIRIAYRDKIPWSTVEELLTSVLGKKDAELAKHFLDMTVEDLPPPFVNSDGTKEANGWWLSNLVGWFAENATDTNKKAELQDKAGEILALSLKGKI